MVGTMHNVVSSVRHVRFMRDPFFFSYSWQYSLFLNPEWRNASDQVSKVSGFGYDPKSPPPLWIVWINNLIIIIIKLINLKLIRFWMLLKKWNIRFQIKNRDLNFSEETHPKYARMMKDVDSTFSPHANKVSKNDKNQEVTYQAETACVHSRLNRQFVSQGSPLVALLTTLEDTNSLGYLVFVNVDITHACLQFLFWSSVVQTDSNNVQP